MKRDKAEKSGGRARTGPGRPALTADQVADTRARIVACALALFHEEGYVGISMRRLAREVGCTPMTLYKYFDDKFSILRALWTDVLGTLFDQLDALAAAETDPAARLSVVAQGYVDFWLSHRDHYFLVFMSGGITQDDVSGFMSDESVVLRFDLFRRCVAGALGGGCRPEDIRVKSEVLVCGLNGVAQGLVTISGYPWADASTLVQEVVANVSGGRGL